jgi:hypothetical protein
MKARTTAPTSGVKMSRESRSGRARKSSSISAPGR